MLARHGMHLGHRIFGKVLAHSFARSRPVCMLCFRNLTAPYRLAKWYWVPVVWCSHSIVAPSTGGMVQSLCCDPPGQTRDAAVT